MLSRFSRRESLLLFCLPIDSATRLSYSASRATARALPAPLYPTCPYHTTASLPQHPRALGHTGVRLVLFALLLVVVLDVGIVVNIGRFGCTRLWGLLRER